METEEITLNENHEREPIQMGSDLPANNSNGAITIQKEKVRKLFNALEEFKNTIYEHDAHVNDLSEKQEKTNGKINVLEQRLSACEEQLKNRSTNLNVNANANEENVEQQSNGQNSQPKAQTTNDLRSNNKDEKLGEETSGESVNDSKSDESDGDNPKEETKEKEPNSGITNAFDVLFNGISNSF